MNSAARSKSTSDSRVLLYWSILGCTRHHPARCSPQHKNVTALFYLSCTFQWPRSNVLWVMLELLGVHVDHVELHTITVSSMLLTPTGLSINDHSRIQSLSFIILTVFHAIVVILSEGEMLPMLEQVSLEFTWRERVPLIKLWHESTHLWRYDVLGKVATWVENYSPVAFPRLEQWIFPLNKPLISECNDSWAIHRRVQHMFRDESCVSTGRDDGVRWDFHMHTPNGRRRNSVAVILYGGNFHVL